MSKPKPLPTPEPPVASGPTERRIYDTQSAAEYLGKAAATLERWRLQGLGPRWFRVGPKSVRYLQGDLDAFLLAGYRTSTSDWREQAEA